MSPLSSLNQVRSIASLSLRRAAVLHGHPRNRCCLFINTSMCCGEFYRQVPSLQHLLGYRKCYLLLRGLISAHNTSRPDLTHYCKFVSSKAVKFWISYCLLPHTTCVLDTIRFRELSYVTLKHFHPSLLILTRGVFFSSALVLAYHRTHWPRGQLGRATAHQPLNVVLNALKDAHEHEGLKGPHHLPVHDDNPVC
jgi:hypothetical protein